VIRLGGPREESAMLRTIALTAAVLAAVPAAASAAPGLGPATSFHAAFTSRHAGHVAGLTLRTTGQPPAPPTTEAPAARQTVTLPAGTRLRLRALAQCEADDATLAAQGAAAACPASTRVGSGRAEGVLGGKPVAFDLAVYAVRGKLLFASGKQGFWGVASGRRLALTVPTLNGMIAPTLFRAQLDHVVRTPRTCHGHWRFRATFQGLTGVDGSPVGPAQHLSDAQRCR
jgi:hypothetical protein